MTLLKDIVQIEKGRKYNLLEENRQGAIRVFQANDFRNEDKPLYTLESDGVFADEDDIMLVWDGSVGQMGFGRSGYVGSTMVKLKVKNKKLFSPYFLYRFLQTKSEYLKRKATGATIMHINRKSLEQLEIPDMNLNDQLHIANILSKAENLISQRKESIRLLDEFLKSTFWEMFGDPVMNNKKWKTLPFSKVGQFYSGGTPSKSNPAFWQGDFPWISPKDMKLAYIKDSQDHISELVFKETALKRVKSYSLLIVVRGMILAHSFPVAINEVEVAINQDMKAIQPNDNFNVFYLLLCLNQLKRQILNQISSASHGTKKFDSTVMNKLEIPAPPIELQTQFAQIVEKTEALKTQYQQSLQELENLYGSLSQKAFRGELVNKEEAIISLAVEPKTDYPIHSRLPIPQQKKGFAKLVLAGKIINECNDSPEFTNIKFQKLQHLAEHLMEADLNLNYYNQAAGPYDNKFMHTLRDKMKQQKWFSSRGYNYSPLEKSNEIDGHFSRYFGVNNEQFTKLIKLLGKASEDQCEIISTLYAVWNDRIIKEEPITYGAIIEDFFNWSERKQKYNTEQLTKAIKWMKENNLEPKGFGELIKHSKKKNAK